MNLHDCAKKIVNLRTFWTKLRKTGKTGTNFMYLSQFDKVFLVSHDYMSFLTHISVKNFQSELFDCTKEFAFRQSAYKTVVDGACTYGDNF